MDLTGPMINRLVAERSMTRTEKDLQHFVSVLDCCNELACMLTLAYSTELNDILINVDRQWNF